MSKKIRVAVLYGGRSGEHEVSLQSAASVIRYLDKEKYEIIPIGIDKTGRWHLSGPEVLASTTKALPIYRNMPEVVMPSNPDALSTGVVALASGASTPTTFNGKFDVVFPVMHGTFSEDGTIQGLLELADVPYVGCGVLASAVGMDKDIAKRVMRDAGLQVVPWVTVRNGEWARNPSALEARIAKELGFPCFVKPANAGSSVGVHKVKTADALAAAINDALRYDTKILVEKAISVREIELSVLENIQLSEEPLVSVVGEVTPTHEFYSYEAKYLDENGAALHIPALLTPTQMKTAQDIARCVFTALECEGLARVDLFLDKESGEFYVNEINTLPGFTSISMYPKLWEASGISYADLLSKLVDLALARHTRKSNLVRDFLVE
ncbi:D-alanine--D-alanine ligase family protein [Glaciimonas soli]|uniref:D-alanine--D-alanine ligase n=1 Tax=Glaciimonas soli TaxID=2590999 RepID=A0A843YMJ5_9BURK|nr:D-alanine--D-alanine ligase family protein [Glaciimonas soli]MQR01099.1 D-alanine--D-alanine ligase [Glaciimonas soli]